ncbi:cation diffusion facilitator family transporter [Tumebacillus sp. DT12]|uniref:Cation diffusion facilitator family transporter n=1 Tax=Tumebacillus lacus TaxID=2995335 RepID=A0ABT3WYL6_9BACL|nr:cation diffusion facilitator family transporter [Tumebacillus lacus]MCX7568582.1 cation diffusion facilitator family transporter [Tumebacillus lacus]
MNHTQKGTALFAAWISLLSNLFLTVIKLGVGLLFNSPVLVADGVHNGADVVASLAALSSMRISSRPADEDHPYGHGKAEVIASGAVGIILALAAMMIGYHSFLALFEPAHEAHWIALVAALISMVWKQLLYVFTIRIGKASNSKGLIATAYDHLADVWASLAAVIGIGLALLDQHVAIPFAQYGDPLSGIIVSALVLKLAYDMCRESVEILMEKAVEPDKLSEYERLVLSVPQVKRIDRLRAREHGHYILVDVRVGISGELSVQEGHDIGRAIKLAIMNAHSDVDEVLVHLNPWYATDVPPPPHL